MAYRVNASKGKLIYPEIMYQTYSQIEAMLSHHEKVLLFRLEIHYHSFESTNQIISKLVSKLKRRLNTKAYKFIKRLGYVWAREQKTSEAPHYHAVFFLDGDKYQYPGKIIDLIEDVCDRLDFPKPYTPKNCYYRLRRSQLGNRVMRSAIYRISYLAKVNTKGNRPEKTHDYGTSRIKPRQNTGVTQ